MGFQQILFHSGTPSVETLIGGKGVAHLLNISRRGYDLFSVENCCNLCSLSWFPFIASDPLMV